MHLSLKFSAISFLALLFACTSNPDKPPESVTKTPVTLDASEIFNLHSSTFNEDFRIRVRLPASYASSPEKQYPVVIKVDGQWDFLLAASAYNCLYFDGQMPETIFVGIDWPDAGDNIHAIRSRDLLPSPASYFEGSGKANEFIDVLQNDLVPQLAERYRFNGKRYLLGGSWGAVFTTYALLERPDFFDGAIAIGGGYEPFEPAFSDAIKALANSNQLHNKRLYLGVGRYDAVAPSVLQLATQLEDANLEGFDVKLHHLEGFGHSGMNVPGYAGGYQFMFKRPVIAVNRAILKAHSGTYRQVGEGGARLVFAVEKGKLVANTQDGTSIALLAKSNNEFYHPGMFYEAAFEGNAVTVETFFGVQTFEKISR